MKVNHLILAIGFSWIVGASSAVAASGNEMAIAAPRWPRACSWITDQVAAACGGNKPCDCDAACDAYEELCHKDEHDTFSEGTWAYACKGRKDCNGDGPAVGHETSATEATW